MEQTKKESLLERYWRLRGQADELYQRLMRAGNQRINEEMRKSVQRELDALEDAIERADLVEVLRHKLILEVLLGPQSSLSPKGASDSLF
jgi:predicted nuclease with TOPRIM domain